MTLTRRAVAAGFAATLVPQGRAAAQPVPPEEDGFRVLAAAPLKMKLHPDAPAEAELWAFNGAVPGPILRVRHGEEVRVRLKNRTPAPLSLHWHGVRIANAMDGVGGLTQAPVAPGQDFDYRFTPPDAGTYLFRPCVPGVSAEAAERGLSGLLVVEERAAAPVDREHVVVFDDLKAYVIGLDGQPTESFEPLRSTLPFAPGTRYDVLVELGPEARAKGAVTALIGPGVPLVAITVAGAPPKRPPLPPVVGLPENKLLPPAIRLQSAARRDVVIAGGARRGASGEPVYDGDPRKIWTVNGAAGEAGAKPLLSVKRGTPVVLAINNTTPTIQPLHLHGHVFRLLHAFDDGWEPFFLDTMQVPESRTVRIAFVADNPGKWLLASSVLERFDTGLWTWFEVT